MPHKVAWKVHFMEIDPHVTVSRNQPFYDKVYTAIKGAFFTRIVSK